MKPPKGVRKAVKAFLGVRKRDVSRWPDLDRPHDYKDRLRNSKQNYGIETSGLSESLVRQPRSTSASATAQQKQPALPPSTYQQHQNHEEDQFYPPPHHHHQWEEDHDSAYGAGREDEMEEEEEARHQYEAWQQQQQQPPQIPPKTNQLRGDPWDGHKQQSQPSTSKATSTTFGPPPASPGRNIDERLKSCMSELDRLTSQLDTVVNLTEKLDQMRPGTKHQQEDHDDPIETTACAEDSDEAPPMSVPYSNLPPHKGEVDQRNYHRGIIKGSSGAEEEEEADRASLPPRLPSRTPSTNRIVPPAHHQPSNKRLNQIQEVDNWSSSGYSSGSFESIPSYHHHHNAYHPHQAESVYGGGYQQDPYGCYHPSEGEYGEYGAWDPQQQQQMVSRDSWYYLTPPSVDGSDVYQLTPYDEWAAYGGYHGKGSASSSQYGATTAAAAPNGAASSRTVSSDSTSSSSKRKTVRFSKTVRERRHDKRETTAAMKGAAEDAGAVAADDDDRVYHFPRGHIETSCMCEECVLARHSIQQREYQAYYA